MSNLSWIERLLAGDPQVRAAECRADIEDEVADHLQALAGRYAAEGESPEAAGAKAQADFGDASRVVRQCLWIHLGDQVMLRSLSLLLGVALCFVGCLLTYASIQTQRDMAAGFKELTSQLARINEREPAAPPPPRRPELHGHLYLGDPSRPAANAYAEIYRLPEGDVQRVVFADEDGKFSVTYLPEGEYSVLTPLVGPGNPIHHTGNAEERHRPLYQVQSLPFEIVFGEADTSIELDVEFQPSDLRIELSSPLAERLGDPVHRIFNALQISFDDVGLPLLPWNPTKTAPRMWPAKGAIADWLDLHQSKLIELGSFESALHLDLGGPRRAHAPGAYYFRAFLGVGIRPPDDPRAMVTHTTEVQRLLALGESWPFLNAPGSLIRPDLARHSTIVKTNPQTITLAPGMRTIVRLKIPSDRNERLGQILFSDTATNEELATACTPVGLEFEVIGQEPLEITDEVEQQN